MLAIEPVKLTSPRVWRTYRGGSQIDAIRGNYESADTQFPEEWIISVVNARNAGREQIQDEGLCYLAEKDITLRDYISADPEAMLGEAHCHKFGNTTGVLVKIIDSAERLTIQAHPNKQRARELFGSAFGKTECWHILGCRSIEGHQLCIYVGFKEGVTREYWKELFECQNIPTMLDCLHCFPVKPGETYLIEGGVPHAIGAGCLLVEIQEPTDYTVRTERVSPKGLVIQDYQCHQGLGFDRMFNCFDYYGLTHEDAYDRWCIQPVVQMENAEFTCTELIGECNTSCFRLERYDIRGTCVIPSEEVMNGLYFFQGAGTMITSGSRPVKAGDQYFVPAGSGAFSVTASGNAPITLFRFFGPKI